VPFPDRQPAHCDIDEGAYDALTALWFIDDARRVDRSQRMVRAIDARDLHAAAAALTTTSRGRRRQRTSGAEKCQAKACVRHAVR
jgi:hypothetical protein